MRVVTVCDSWYSDTTDKDYNRCLNRKKRHCKLLTDIDSFLRMYHQSLMHNSKNVNKEKQRTDTVQHT